MKLYHGTAQEFARFDMAFAVRPEAASNGYLGVWLTKTPEAAGAFGPVVLEVEANFNSTKIIKIDHLRRWHESRQVEDARIYYDTRRGAEANLVIGDLHLKLCARSLRVLKRKIKPMLGRSLRPVNIDHAFDQVNGKATFDFNFDLSD